MKILNIVDVSIVRIVLTKYYIAKDLTYEFSYPEVDHVRKKIEAFKPDLIVIQAVSCIRMLLIFLKFST